MASNTAVALCFLCLFICAQECYTSDILEDSGRLEKYFRDSLEEVRGKMGQGFKEFGIPPLEPLVLHDVKLNTNNQMAKIALHLHEIRLSGLSTFRIDDMMIKMEDLIIGIKFSFPKLTAKGWYEVDGTLLQVFPVFGKGNYTIVARDAVVGGKGRLVLTAETMEVTDLEPHLDWTSMDLDLKNFLGGGNFSDAVQRILPIIGKMAFQQFRPDILKTLGNFVTKELNAKMTQPEVKGLVQKILEELTEIEELKN